MLDFMYENSALSFIIYRTIKNQMIISTSTYINNPNKPEGMLKPIVVLI